MKLSKKIFFVLLAGIILLSSCKEKTAPQLSAIPSNATFVVVLETQKMVQKGGLNKLSDYNFFQKAQSEMANMNPVLKNLTDEFLKDPKSSGLDFETIYIYGAKEGNTFYCSMNFKMDNQGTFEKKMTELLQIQDQNIPEVKDMGDYKIVSQGGATISWNNDLLQLFWGDVSAIDMKSCFDLPSDKSILSVSDFASFKKESHDMGLWISYSELLKYIEYSGISFKMPAYLNEFADSYIHGYLNFENGEIKALGRMSPQSKVDEFMKKYPVIKKDFNTALLEDFPDKSYFLTKVSINWEEYLKLMSESLAQMQQMPGMDTYSEIMKDPTVKTLFDIVEGDMVFSIYNLAQGPLPIPLAGLSFTLKKAEDFERLLALFPKDMLNKNDGYYMITTPFGVGINIACKDRRVLITDDADAVTSFIKKGFSPNLKNGPMANELKKSPALFYMNLDLESYPENLRALLKNLPSDAQMGLSFLAPFKDVTYYVNEKNEVIFSLKFKDNKQNSLKTVLKTVDDVVAKQ